MAWLGVAAAAALIVLVVIDSFEVMILPRRVSHSYRLADVFYRSTWYLWRAAGQKIPAGRRRHGFLGIFGPLSLLGLLVLWALGLVSGFALLHWSVGSPVAKADCSFLTYLY